MLIGVLAVQGAFKEHSDVLRSLGVQAREVRKISELEGLDGLIIPGGESTTMKKFLNDEGLHEGIQKSGLPIFGTCAGAIILADMGLIDIQVDRNAYGRQLESFVDNIDFNSSLFKGVFIRAPKIVSVGEGVSVLSKHEDDPVLVRQGRILVATFHPELTDDTRVHQYFLESVCD